MSTKARNIGTCSFGRHTHGAVWMLMGSYAWCCWLVHATCTSVGGHKAQQDRGVLSNERPVLLFALFPSWPGLLREELLYLSLVAYLPFLGVLDACRHS